MLYPEEEGEVVVAPVEEDHFPGGEGARPQVQEVDLRGEAEDQAQATPDSPGVAVQGVQEVVAGQL